MDCDWATGSLGGGPWEFCVSFICEGFTQMNFAFNGSFGLGTKNSATVEKDNTGLFHSGCQLLVSPERIPGRDSYREQIMLINEHSVLA